MESNAEAGLTKHREVVGSVADCNSLCDVHLFHLCYKAQKLCFAMTVDNLTDITACEFSVTADFKFVGIDIIDAVAPL